MTSTTKTSNFKRQLRPHGRDLKYILTTLRRCRKFLKKEAEEKEKRREFLESDEFYRKYDLPIHLHKKYIDNSQFDLEYYSIENIEKRS